MTNDIPSTAAYELDPEKDKDRHGDQGDGEGGSGSEEPQKDGGILSPELPEEVTRS